MTMDELAERLQAAGCAPDSYALGTRGAASDAFCLVCEGALWQVFYTERGVDQAPFFESPSEAEACEFFYRTLTSLRHEHCVGFFRSSGAAQALAERLAALGVGARHDQIFYRQPDDWRHRVFVGGADIARFRELFGASRLEE
mgnify:CR=1 FL=1